MSDFLYSNNIINSVSIFTNYFKEINNKALHCFEGTWGKLVINKNHYNGFEPYEDENHLCAVIGGPVLNFSNNNFIANISEPSLGTQQILHRYRVGIDWSKDLDGPFVVIVINKITNDVKIITDVLSFIPCYQHQSKEEIVISSHVDLLAEAANIKKIDDISTADFILSGAITFPFTIYENIFQMDPGSEHIITKNKVKNKFYWLPEEKEMYKSVKAAATDGRNAIQNYVNNITNSLEEVAHFISGGEDSRTISSLLNKDLKRDAFIFLEGMNREGKLAKRVAEVYGSNFHLIKRDKYHYLNILSEANKLVGSGSQYIHCHALNLHEKGNLTSYSAVFGGLFSDALLKGSHIKKISFSGRIPFLPQIPLKNHKETVEHANLNIDWGILKERKKAHLTRIKKIRPVSYREWYELWPTSMNVNSPNFHCTRRLFRSYEPFTSTALVKVAAKTPQNFKLNRILFREIAKPFLKKSWYLTHSDGRMPYFGWILNSMLIFTKSVRNKLKAKFGYNVADEGPWVDWETVMLSKEYERLIKKSNNSSLLRSEILNINELKTVQKNFDSLQQLNYLQMEDSISKLSRTNM